MLNPGSDLLGPTSFPVDPLDPLDPADPLQNSRKLDFDDRYRKSTTFKGNPPPIFGEKRLIIYTKRLFSMKNVELSKRNTHFR